MELGYSSLPSLMPGNLSIPGFNFIIVDTYARKHSLYGLPSGSINFTILLRPAMSMAETIRAVVHQYHGFIMNTREITLRV